MTRRADRARRPMPALGAIAGAATLAVLLVRLAPHLPPSPPLAEPTRWPSWAAALDPLDAAAGVVRVALLGGAAYLGTVGVLALVTVVRPTGGATRALRLLAPRLLAATLAGSVLAHPAAPAAAAADDDIWMERLEVVHSGTGVPTGWVSGALHPGGDPPFATLDPATEPPPPPDRSHVVVAGEHLWGIAEDTVAAATGSAEERVVAAYWVTLVESNRHRLADPTNPDLIHSGLRLELPELPGPGVPPLSGDAPPPSGDGG